MEGTRKINLKLPKFSGQKGEDLEVFKTNLAIHFRHHNITNDLDKVETVILYLRGKIASHMNGKAISFVTEGKSLVPEIWKDYDTFLTDLREASGKYYDSTETAQTQMHNLRQGKLTIIEYNETFKRILAYLPSEYKPGTNGRNPVTIHLYKNRLNPSKLQQLVAIPSYTE